MSPVLVTGATGFVGSHLAELLLSRGERVRCLVRPGRPSLSWVEGLPVEAFEADMEADGSASRLLDDVRTVYHVAGVTKAGSLDEYRQTNVGMTRRLLEASVRQGVERFIYISSLTAVGPSTDGTPLDESAPCVPITDYGRSKLEAEQVCHQYADRLSLTILRPPAVYGPRDKDILEMFRWVSFGLRPTIGSRSKMLSLLHARDLATAAIVAAAEPNTSGKTYFVTDPEPYPFDSLIAMIAEISGRRTFPVRLPGPVVYGAALAAQTVSPLIGRTAVLTIEKARDILQPYWVCSSRAFERDSGFSSEVPVRQGLQETFVWYRAQGWIR